MWVESLSFRARESFYSGNTIQIFFVGYVNVTVDLELKVIQNLIDPFYVSLIKMLYFAFDLFNSGDVSLCLIYFGPKAVFWFSCWDFSF